MSNDADPFQLVLHATCSWDLNETLRVPRICKKRAKSMFWKALGASGVDRGNRELHSVWLSGSPRQSTVYDSDMLSCNRILGIYLGSQPLERLRISEVHLSEAALAATISQTSATLVSLELCNIVLKPDGPIRDFCESCLDIHPSLKKFTLSAKMPQDENSQVSLMRLLRNAVTSPKLEAIEIDVDLTRALVGPELFFAALHDAWVPSMRLKHLTISQPLLATTIVADKIYNRLYHKQESGPWSDSCPLKRFHTKNQAIVRTIVNVLETSTTLESLSLPVWQNNLLEFATALKSNRSIQTLRLRLEEDRVSTRRKKQKKRKNKGCISQHTVVPEEAAVAFCYVMEGNSVIQDLHVDGAASIINSKASLLLLLYRLGLKRLLRVDSRSLWWNMIINNKEQLSCVFHLLSERPNLIADALAAKEMS